MFKFIVLFFVLQGTFAVPRRRTREIPLDSLQLVPEQTPDVFVQELEPEILFVNQEPIKRSLMIVPVMEPEQSQLIQTENVEVLPKEKSLNLESLPVEEPKVVETPVLKPVNKKSKFFWFNDDDEDDRLDVIEKKQKILYSLILCGTSNTAECKKVSQMATQLFNKILGNDDTTSTTTTTVPPPTAVTNNSLPPVIFTVSSTTTTTAAPTTTRATSVIPIPANAVPIDQPTP